MRNPPNIIVKSPWTRYHFRTYRLYPYKMFYAWRKLWHENVFFMHEMSKINFSCMKCASMKIKILSPPLTPPPPPHSTNFLGWFLRTRNVLGVHYFIMEFSSMNILGQNHHFKMAFSWVKMPFSCLETIFSCMKLPFFIPRYIHACNLPKVILII